MNTTTVRARRTALALVTATALVAGSGACGGDRDADLPPAPASSTGGPRSTLDPERQAILDAYHGAVETMVRAQQADDPDLPDLSRYFVERTPALNGLRNTINNNRIREMYYAGDLTVTSAEITELDLEAEPPAATVEACLDYSEYRLVNREDDSPVPEARPVGRVTAVAEVVTGPDGHWYLLTHTPHWDDEC